MEIGLWGVFTVALITGFSGAMPPGSMFTMVVNYTLRRGFFSGPLMVAGHGILEGLFILAFIAGLGQFLHNDGIIGTIALVGGSILFYMGLDIICSIRSGQFNLDINQTETPSSTLKDNPLIVGAFTSIINPYWTLWWLTGGAALLISSYRYGIVGLLVFFTGHILADLIWYSFISYLVSGGKRFFNQQVFNGALGACGLFLMVFALKFLYDGWRLIFPMQ